MALNKKYGNVGTYSLDRVVTIAAVPNIDYDESLNREHTKHFRNIFGVTLIPNKEPIEV